MVFQSSCSTSSVASDISMGSGSLVLPQFGSVGMSRDSLGRPSILVGVMSLVVSSNWPEITYIIRFVELNHRGEHNPWSLRQTLVFHRSSVPTTLSFVALSDAMNQVL